MFNIEFLHQIRDFELQRIIQYLPPNAKILEIGGGTGLQAKILADHGFSVESIDIASSLYRDQHVYPVLEYDGEHFPFPDKSFDVVFSSNVLEHIKNLDQIHKETLRVLRPEGYCLHILPSGAWRFWTNIAHYVEMLQKVFQTLFGNLSNFTNPRTVLNSFKQMAKIIIGYRFVPRHGEVGNALTEIYTFSKASWLKHFTNNNIHIKLVEPMGLFYTGHMVFGKRISISFRKQLARFLGSACIIYKLDFGN